MRLVQHDATTNRPHHSGQYDEQPNASDVLFMTRIIHQNNLQLKKQTNCVTNIPNKKIWRPNKNPPDSGAYWSHRKHQHWCRTTATAAHSFDWTPTVWPNAKTVIVRRPIVVHPGRPVTEPLAVLFGKLFDAINIEYFFIKIYVHLHNTTNISKMVEMPATK